MADIKREDVLVYLENANMLEISELIKEIEDKFGVTAAAPIAIAGGAEAPSTPIAVAGFNACMALSKQNDSPKLASRPFDSKRDGFVMGEGSGILIIESEESVV